MRKQLRVSKFYWPFVVCGLILATAFHFGELPQVQEQLWQDQINDLSTQLEVLRIQSKAE